MYVIEKDNSAAGRNCSLLVKNRNILIKTEYLTAGRVNISWLSIRKKNTQHLSVQCNTVERQSCDIQVCTLRAQCRCARALQGFAGCDRDSATFYENIMSARTNQMLLLQSCLVAGVHGDEKLMAK